MVKLATEDNMIALKSLTLTAMPTIGANPTLDRRQKVIARLEEQKTLVGNPNFTRTIRQRVRRRASRRWSRSNRKCSHGGVLHPMGLTPSGFARAPNLLNSTRARQQLECRRWIS